MYDVRASYHVQYAWYELPGKVRRTGRTVPGTVPVTDEREPSGWRLLFSDISCFVARGIGRAERQSRTTKRLPIYASERI